MRTSDRYTSWLDFNIAPLVGWSVLRKQCGARARRRESIARMKAKRSKQRGGYKRRAKPRC